MSGTSIDFNQMLKTLENYVSLVSVQLQSLQSSGGSGGVDIGTMFQLQFRMQMMSQYIEAVSNCLTSVHTEMITMARATKGS